MQNVIDETVDITELTEEEMEKHLIKTYRRLIVLGRERSDEARETTRLIGELNVRSVFLSAAGKVPAELQKLVQSMLSTEDDVIVVSEEKKENTDG